VAVETKTFIPVEEYLHTDYSPDCDYVDGELVERNVGERDHGNLQVRISSHFLVAYGSRGFDVVVEQRVQVTATRYRVPDVCVARLEHPMPQIFRKPPLLVIEILSPEDRFSVLEKKVNDYLEFGIPNIWVIDPWERRAFIYTRQGRLESADLILRTPDGEIVLPLAEIFAQM
jgi:Uma2 family endonuclease